MTDLASGDARGAASEVFASDVAIIGGSGALGYGLAMRLMQAGVSVAIGSRDEPRAQETAARLSAAVGGVACAGHANGEAAASAPVVVLAVPFISQASTLKVLATALAPGQIVLDTTVPLASAAGGRPTRVLGVPQGSAAQQARELLPQHVRLVAGLHTVSAATLSDPASDLDEHVLLCGDDRAATAQVGALIERVPGLRPIDCGRLELARSIEQLTPLMISINVRHRTHAGVRIVGLPDRG